MNERDRAYNDLALKIFLATHEPQGVDQLKIETGAYTEHPDGSTSYGGRVPGNFDCTLNAYDSRDVEVYLSHYHKENEVGIVIEGEMEFTWHDKKTGRVQTKICRKGDWFRAYSTEEHVAKFNGRCKLLIMFCPAFESGIWKGYG